MIELTMGQSTDVVRQYVARGHTTSLAHAAIPFIEGATNTLLSFVTNNRNTVNAGTLTLPTATFPNSAGATYPRDPHSSVGLGGIGFSLCVFSGVQNFSKAEPESESASSMFPSRLAPTMPTEA